ncbi:flagellar hook-associated protein FlgL [Piscinibacter sp. HJYY11]|uniref:flagellar hook-associated protein FlgL n=1 Tax=Piscinibacter sp. HJYY11 TaxID=2801333 RepID=UPI00191D1D9D|nr:flagellar hook-associated protein FlgL [Piscinibacter sp. HJYY11]MBL0727569.1 flagellar hook-associated protein FlgL [Piscinibacter sp. HJYY11]
MRVSTANSFDASVDSLIKRQTQLATAQEQLTTGKRVNRASDDPAAAARAERALAAEKHTDAMQRAVNASQNAMTLSESALGDASDLLQQIREAMVASGNGSYSDQERRAQADKIAGLRTQLLAVANRQDGAGAYLFGGQSPDHAPFLDAAGGVTYQGTAGQIDAASGDPLPLTVDGRAAWMSGRTGNGVFTTAPNAANTGQSWVDTGRVTNPSLVTGDSYSIVFAVAGGVTTYSVMQNGAPTAIAGVPYVSGRAIEIDGLSATVTGVPADTDSFELAPATSDLNIFNQIDAAVAALNTPLRTPSQIAQTNSTYLAAVDSAMAQMQSVRAQVGETLGRIDNATGRLDDLRLAAQTDRSNAEGLDMVKAISDFQNKQTGYDAALKSYSLVQKMSLFNYIT